MRNYSSSLSFTDLLFNLLLSFVSLFVLSFLLINPNNNDGIITPKAEFIITLTWSEESNDDIDLWVEDPEGNVVFFLEPESNLMHLDRDDRGVFGDSIRSNDREVVLNHNQEVVTVRGILPGEYVVNIHVFHLQSSEPISSNIQVLKVNPYSVVCNEDVDIDRHGEEITICRFKLDSSGNVQGTNKLPKSLR